MICMFKRNDLMSTSKLNKKYLSSLPFVNVDEENNSPYVVWVVEKA